MNTIQTRVDIESYLATAFTNSISVSTNSNAKEGKRRIHFTLLLTFILTLNALFTSAATYYISPTGSDAANGSISAPKATLGSINMQPGDIVYMRGGTYNYSTPQIITGKNGTISDTIKIWAYPGENPIFDFTNIPVATTEINAFQVTDCNYLFFKGLRITNVVEPTVGRVIAAWRLWGSSNNKLERCQVDHIGGTGFLLKTTSGYNYFLNCDALYCADPYPSNGELAYDRSNGFTMTDTGEGNIFEACRAWWNCDDGFDAYHATGVMTFKNCWAFWNGYIPGTFTWASPGGDGDGFKLSGSGVLNTPTVVKRILYNCLSFENNELGFQKNGGQFASLFYNNISYSNNTGGIDLNVPGSTSIIRNNISYSNSGYNSYVTGTVDHNTFLTGWNSNNSSYSVTTADFASISSAGMDGPRQANGSLPVLSFLHLVSSSDLINTGINVGLPFSGTAPDVSAFEFSSTGSNQPPVILNQAFSVNENSPNGTAVGNVVATDPDAGQTLTYTILSGNTNSAFALNSSTGAITVANSAALNYEVLASYSLVIKVQDNGTGNLSSQATITVNLLNVNELPVISNQAFSLNENSANATAVGTVLALDPDAGQTLAYSILSGNTNSAFSLNSSTGAITVINSAALNYEVLASYSLVIKVQDNGTGNLSSQATITVNLLNVNEPPVVDNQVFSVPELAADGTLVGTVTATDPDAGQTRSFTITSGNTGSAFSISATTGAITVASSAALNFLVNPAFTLGIRVTDNGTGNLFDDAIITVNVIQNANQAPVITNQSFSVNENSPNGTSLGIVLASDPNPGQVLTYSILSGNTNSAFAINASTGALTVANSATLNYEAIPSFALTVKVQDNGTGNLSNQAIVTVSLFDVNEPPVSNNQVFTVPELSANGTVVGVILVTDPDAGQTLSFSILSGNTGSAFAINGSTGSITVTSSAALNFLTNPSFNLNVRVTDNGAGNLYDDAIMTINLIQSPNLPPVISNQTFSVNEHSPNGTVAGIVLATDPNAGQTLSFSIISGNTNNAFALNSTTGVLTIADSSKVNYETLSSYVLGVKVQDNGPGTLSSQAIATELVINVNETPLINNQSFDIFQSAANGSLVGTVLASDLDLGQTLTYSILSGNTNNAFAINANTGLLTVSNSAALANNAGGTSYSVFQSLTPPGTLINSIGNGTAPLEVGMKFTSNVNGYISALRFYKGAGATGTHTGNLWSLDGTNLASATFTGETASGWQTVTLSTPVAITANTVYVVSYFSEHGDYVKSYPYFTTDIVNGPLTALGWTSSQPNGIYTYSSGPAFPNNNAYIGSSNYWADVIFSSATPPGSFSLVVKVQDNGIGNLSNQASVSVNIINGNQTPVFNNQAFSIYENSANGTSVGTPVASDPDAGQTLTYLILSGNTNNAFAINSSTGAITVANSSALVYQTNPVFTLNVRVTDNGTGNLYDDAIITINVLQNANLPPVINNQAFAINENSVNGTTVGTVLASDPNAGQTLTFIIISGNTSGAFSINPSTGMLTVANSAALNYEAIPSFALIIKAQDNGAGTLSSTATVTVTIKNVNEYPVIANQSFNVNQFAVKGTVVGTVIASDPDAGQTLTYAITAGNTSTAFSIIASSGVIKVYNKAALNCSINPVFHLTVRVRDNGTGLLASSAIITINVLAGKSGYILNITSTPQDTVSALSLYSYNIAGYSGRGTVLHYSAKDLPGWLSLRDNENGTATLEGTPQMEDIGTAEVVLNVTDSALEVQQAFSIEVKSSALNNIHNQKAVGMNIYPNPVTDGILHVKLDDGIHEQFELSIMDLSGKILIQKTYEDANLMSLDLSSFPPSIYLIQLRSLNFRFFDKVIVK
jgi:hypothetical protein